MEELKSGKNLKKSKFFSGRNYEQVEVRKCLLSYRAKFLSTSLLSKNINMKVCRTTILPVVLYRCKTGLLTLREDHGLSVFESMLPRRIFEH